MLNVINAANFRQLDAYTIQAEPIASIDLMERAAFACVQQLNLDYPESKKITIFAGTGNNGGDGLAMARHLTNQGKIDRVIVSGNIEKCSKDFSINYNRCKSNGIEILENPSLAEISESLEQSDLVIDAIFGNGLTRPVEGRLSEVIELINTQKDVVSIDLPSGMAADPEAFDHYTSEVAIVRATKTYTFQVTKLNMLLDDLMEYYGQIEILDIGLDKNYQESLPSLGRLALLEDCTNLIRVRTSAGHKGSFGHALLLAGQYKMMGAAILATRACLRSGVGLLTLHTPAKAVQVVQIAIPECLIDISTQDNTISALDISKETIEKSSAMGIGCGIGAETLSPVELVDYIGHYTNEGKPCLIDADALNILSKDNNQLVRLRGRPVVLTPHPKEFDRLFGKSYNCFERLKVLKQKAKELQIHILLKGATTALAKPNGDVIFFPYANSGMAKGGTGDVLAGIITSLLAQNYPIEDAAVVGIGAHTSIGYKAKKQYSEHVMLPSDIVEGLADYFL